MSWKCSGCLLHSHHSDSWEAQDLQNGPNMSECNRMYHIYIYRIYVPHSPKEFAHDYRLLKMLQHLTLGFMIFISLHRRFSIADLHGPSCPSGVTSWWLDPWRLHHPLKYGWNIWELFGNRKPWFGSWFGQNLWSRKYNILSSCGAKQCCKRNETRLQHLKLCPPKSSVISYACELQSPW